MTQKWAEGLTDSRNVSEKRTDHYDFSTSMQNLKLPAISPLCFPNLATFFVAYTFQLLIL